ncbi:TetR family transcriptional regulator C-terminal domain-containing protein [Streptomyces sp. DH24]|uniref:TetR family transcriptional regulator C-terminal domain-containing protein n=1 Tax=Streptomyces sp. DH24 TaxID=3040123 RepID=UPI0030155964
MCARPRLQARASLTVDGEPAFPRLILQVWAETLRNPEPAAALREGYGAVRDAWTRSVEGHQEAGAMAADVPAQDVARTMVAVVQGFLAQQSLFGATPVEVLRNGCAA